MVYLDYTANTPVDREVLARFTTVEQDFFGNPNSEHLAGRMANEAMAVLTERIAALLKVGPNEIIHTSGATESNNLAIKGIVSAAGGHCHIITSPLEHPSVRACLQRLQREGCTVDTLHLTEEGQIDLEELSALLRPDTALVTLCAVDSELGTVQPVGEAAQIVQKYRQCRLHVDATQAVGKIPLDLTGVHTASFAPHKFYGLGGSGVLVKRRAVELTPLFDGGEGASRYRSGTPTLGLVAACEMALRKAITQQHERYQQVRRLSHFLRHALELHLSLMVNSPEQAVPHILNVSVRGITGRRFQRALDERGVCVSVRSACAQDGQPSQAVLALTGDRQRALSSWRISLSHLTTDEELGEFLTAFMACCTQFGIPLQ